VPRAYRAAERFSASPENTRRYVRAPAESPIFVGASERVDLMAFNEIHCFAMKRYCRARERVHAHLSLMNGKLFTPRRRDGGGRQNSRIITDQQVCTCRLHNFARCAISRRIIKRDQFICFLRSFLMQFYHHYRPRWDPSRAQRRFNTFFRYRRYYRHFVFISRLIRI